ncbi:hypothetical protein GCM10010271_02840 [Streptomyces kurssanovii]|nr:hypothetical protein GCM10010271_02840 [Streptomyces kurssanovii]
MLSRTPLGPPDARTHAPTGATPQKLDRLQHEAALAAERCLLFGACSQARDSLYASWSGDPSTFLTDAGVTITGVTTA